MKGALFLPSLFLLSTAAGCAATRPWQREYLAKRCMEGLSEEGIAGEYQAKVIEATTAGGLPGNAPGGGCGCTQ